VEYLEIGSSQQKLQLSKIQLFDLEIESSEIKGDILELEKKHNTLLDNKSHYEICYQLTKMMGRQKHYNSKLQKLEKIKQYMILARNQCMIEFVDKFNAIINEILARLFEDPINVQLKLEKNIKSTERIKQFVNFEIRFKGTNFDNINFLSGGEKDRLGLGCLISLSILQGNKIVFLDECLSSLDEETRLVCIKTINNYLPGKTVVNICHSVTRGFHDCTRTVN
jgi:ABC-type lipoprotein export system ATPase subunit